MTGDVIRFSLSIGQKSFNPRALLLYSLSLCMRAWENSLIRKIKNQIFATYLLAVSVYMLFLPIRNSDLFLNGGRRRQVIGSVSWSLVSYDSYIWKGNTNQNLFVSFSVSKSQKPIFTSSSSYCFEIRLQSEFCFLTFSWFLRTSMFQLINLLVTVWFFWRWDLKTRKCRVRDTIVPRGLFFSSVLNFNFLAS